MSYERFYWFIDAAATEPVIEMSWTAFLRKYPIHRSRASLTNSLQDSVEHFLAFVVEPEQDAAGVKDILARRTLRWTMQRSTPQYWFLNEVVGHVPSLSKRSRSIWVAHDKFLEPAVLDAIGISAFLDGRIDLQTYWAVHNITGRYEPTSWLTLTPTQQKTLEEARLSGPGEKPIFSWQSARSLDDGYRCLRRRHTQLLVAFLKQAWKENWAAPHLTRDTRAELKIAKGTTPRFRHLELATNLVQCVTTMGDQIDCALSYDESLMC